MNEDFVDRRPGDVEMYRRLDAYAEARLAPDAAAMARIRSALMGRAVALADARAATMAMSLQAPALLPERRSLGRPHLSRWSAAFLAGCLSVGIAAGSVAASAAGGPFYGPRLWLEEATLPSAPLAHAHGQLTRLDIRLEEIRVTTTSGNAGAAEAALLAYAGIVEDLETQALSNPAIAADVLDDVARRQVVLLALLGKVPPQAQDALEQALQQGANAVEAIGTEDATPGDPVRRSGGPTTNQGGSDRSGSGGASGGTGASGSGDGADDEDPTDEGQDGNNRPDEPPDEPDRTPRPDRTPKPKPTATPVEEQQAPIPQPASQPSGGSRDQNEGGSSRQDEGGDDQGGAD